MRFLLKLALFQSFMMLFPHFSGAQNSEIQKNALQIVKNNEQLLDGVGQLLVVFNNSSESSQAILVFVEKGKNGWLLKSEPMQAGVGRNGFAKPTKKREGDGKSPTGVFRMGQLFCYEKNVNTLMPYLQTTADDKWIDDPNSPDYNRHIRGKTDAKSYENLKLSSDTYKYCMLIEYNTNPIVKGMGSAIFFHLGKKIPASTAGCVAINENNMEWVLKQMNPNLHPAMLMGNKAVLLQGLEKYKK